jgi:hypothetical protein
MTRKYSSLYFGVIMACLALLGITANAQEPLNWPEASTFDSGEQISVAISRNGTYIVEFHRSENNSRMWYHVGRLIEQWPSGYAVSWGKSHDIDVKVEWPSVAVTKEGYVILVNSPYGQVVDQIMYWVGKIDLDNRNDQEIHWYLKQQAFGYGFHPDVAVDNSGQIALVYECRNGCTGNLDYRVGHLDNPAAGRFNLIWDSGSAGINYDRGINPHIAINDSGQIIEAHQADTKYYYLHYRRGVLTPNASRSPVKTPYATTTTASNQPSPSPMQARSSRSTPKMTPSCPAPATSIATTPPGSTGLPPLTSATCDTTYTPPSLPTTSESSQPGLQATAPSADPAPFNMRRLP